MLPSTCPKVKTSRNDTLVLHSSLANLIKGSGVQMLVKLVHLGFLPKTANMSFTYLIQKRGRRVPRALASECFMTACASRPEDGNPIGRPFICLSFRQIVCMFLSLNLSHSLLLFDDIAVSWKLVIFY